jgi:hypothetical protein
MRTNFTEPCNQAEKEEAALPLSASKLGNWSQILLPSLRKQCFPFCFKITLDWEKMWVWIQQSLSSFILPDSFCPEEYKSLLLELSGSELSSSSFCWILVNNSIPVDQTSTLVFKRQYWCCWDETLGTKPFWMNISPSCWGLLASCLAILPQTLRSAPGKKGWE